MLFKFSKFVACIVIMALVLLDLARCLALFPGLMPPMLQVAGGDTQLHFIAGFLLEISVALIICKESGLKKALAFSALILLVVLTAAEFSQLLISTRTFQVSDLIAGLIGVTCAWIVFLLPLLVYDEHSYPRS